MAQIFAQGATKTDDTRPDMTRPLRIAYLCDQPPSDPGSYSGGNTRICETLREHVGEVTVLPQGWGLVEPVRRLVSRMPEAVRLRLQWRLHLALAPVIARRVRAELAAGDYDVVFGAYALHAMHHVTPPGPVVTAYTSDAVHTVYRTSEIGDAFDSRIPGGRMLDTWVERREAETLRSLDLVLWPSRWLMRETAARYQLAADQMELVPWGANIPDPAVPAVKAIGDGPVSLLLIGRDWFAKGGPLALETLEALTARGIDATLDVVGCEPPDAHRNDRVTVHGLLDKTVPSDLVTFEHLLRKAHFLVQPSFESYGFAFCEASAHGMPSLCLDVGGVPVWDGENGHALPVGSGAGDFAALIAGYLAAPDRYAALSASSRRLFEERLNWSAWGRRVRGLLEERVARNRGSTSGWP